MDYSELQKEIERLIESKNLIFCQDCGKCTGSCTMWDFYGEYDFDRSPRGIVNSLLLFPEDIFEESLWYCLECDKCTAVCPAGVDFQGFMKDLRELLLDYGHNEHALYCIHCKCYFTSKKVIEHFQKASEWKEVLESLSVCPECRRKSFAEKTYLENPMPLN